MTEPALYVYAIIPESDFVPGVSGVDGLPLEVVRADSGVSAVVHVHRTGPFEGSDTEVKTRILQHGDVVEDCWQRAGAVLPVSFNVIVAPAEDGSASAYDQLGTWLETSGIALTNELDRLTGTSELRVEIALDQQAYCRDSPEIEEMESQLQTQSPGVRRLMSRRLETRRRELTDAAADELYPDLRRRVASRCLAVEEPSGSGRAEQGVPVLTVTCLTDTYGISALGAELSAIQDEVPAALIRFLGPWPPYSFVKSPSLGETAETQ